MFSCEVILNYRDEDKKDGGQGGEGDEESKKL